MSNRWSLLERVAAERGALNLPRAMLAELAIRIDEALSTRNHADQAALADQLRSLVDAAIHNAPAEAGAAARGSQASADSEAAYRLGQYGFAHLVLASAVGRRVDAEFGATLRNATFAPYVAALRAGEMSGIELAERVGREPETVSRNLRRLREMGAVDFRSDGTRHLNFLTPAGRLVADAEDRERNRGRAPMNPFAAAWAVGAKEELTPIMRHAPSFAATLEPTDG